MQQSINKRSFLVTPVHLIVELNKVQIDEKSNNMSTESIGSNKNSLKSHIVALNLNNESLIEQLQQLIAVIEADFTNTKDAQVSVTLCNKTIAAQLQTQQLHQLTVHTFSLLGNEDALIDFMCSLETKGPIEDEARIDIKKCLFRAITQSGSVLSSLEDLLETLPTELITVDDSLSLLQSALELLSYLQTDYQALYALHRMTNEAPLVQANQHLKH